MTDVPPPRPTPPHTDGRRLPETRYSSASMWLVFLVLGAVILAAIAFSVDRSSSVVDPAPVSSTAPAEPTAPATSDPAVVPEATPTVPVEPAVPTEDAPATGDGATGGTTGGGTTQP